MHKLTYDVVFFVKSFIASYFFNALKKRVLCFKLLLLTLRG